MNIKKTHSNNIEIRSKPSSHIEIIAADMGFDLTSPRMKKRSIQRRGAMDLINHPPDLIDIPLPVVASNSYKRSLEKNTNVQESSPRPTRPRRRSISEIISLRRDSLKDPPCLKEDSDHSQENEELRPCAVPTPKNAIHNGMYFKEYEIQETITRKSKQDDGDSDLIPWLEDEISRNDKKTTSSSCEENNQHHKNFIINDEDFMRHVESVIYGSKQFSKNIHEKQRCSRSLTCSLIKRLSSNVQECTHEKEEDDK